MSIESFPTAQLRPPATWLTEIVEPHQLESVSLQISEMLNGEEKVCVLESMKYGVSDLGHGENEMN